MDCPSENTVTEFVEGLLSADEVPLLEAHLARCEKCRRLVSDLAKGSWPATTATPPAPLVADTYPSAPAPAPFIAGTVVGRYLLIERLGAGGMGVVYVAYDPELERKVAIKFLRPDLFSGNERDQVRTRLLREARAMARLSHPNVVAVHDVGAFEDHIFVAMEFVEGTTLGKWCREKQRPWQAVREVYRSAGRGLIAAHAAGLVHRDFKPDNVLIGDDGRPRVTDFGLVTLDGAAPTEPAEAPPLAAASPTFDPITQTGAFLGTPAYMAPEQLAGKPADARSDQFSFCVSLYEALYGERPFAGSTVSALARDAAAGKLRTPSPQRDVPAWLGRVVTRGLAADPAARYPSMQALLDALDQDPSRRWKRLALGTAVAAGAGLFVALGLEWTSRRQAPCQLGPELYASAWSRPRQEAVRRAFLATGKPYAVDAFSSVSSTLDAYTQAWLAMRQGACLAARVRGEQSEEALDLRTHCLNERLDDVRALTELFARADAPVVLKAPTAAASLPSLDACADVPSLRSRVRPPTDPKAAAEVARVREHLARVRALRAGGRAAEALELLRPELPKVRAASYPPLEAEALELLGTLQEQTSDAKGAEQSLREAEWAAEGAREDELAARVWTHLVWVVGYRLSRPDDARLLARQAQAALARLGTSSVIESDLENHLGVLDYVAARHDQAIAHHQRALELRKKALGPKHPKVASSLNNIAISRHAQGEFQQAIAMHQESLAVKEAVLGRQHPDVASSLSNLGAAYVALGDNASAVPLLRRSVETWEASSGRDHPDVAMPLTNLANALTNLGQLAEAEGLYARALALNETLGPEHPKVAPVLSNLSSLYLKQKKYAAALAASERQLRILEKVRAKDHPELAFALEGIGFASLALGETRRATAAFERAVALREASALDPGLLGTVRLGLARALAAQGPKTERQERLLAQAKDELQRGGKRYAETLAELEAFVGRQRQ